MDNNITGVLFTLGVITIIVFYIAIKELIYDRFTQEYRLSELRFKGEGIYWTVQRRRKKTGWKIIYKSSDYDSMQTTYRSITDPIFFKKGIDKEEIILSECVATT